MAVIGAVLVDPQRVHSPQLVKMRMRPMDSIPCTRDTSLASSVSVSASESSEGKLTPKSL